MIEVLVRLALTEGYAAGQSQSELAGLPPLLEVRPKTANSDGRASLTRPASASQVQEIAFEAFGVIASVSTPDAGLLPKLRELVPPHSRPCDVRPVEHRFTLTQDGPGRFSVRHIVAGDERERPGDGVTRLDATDSMAGPAPGDALRQELSSYLASHVNLDLALAVLYDHLHGTIALHAPAHVFVRAGVVSHQRGALLLPGMGLTGKTTLVAELVREGTTYFSDEYAVIDEQGLVHPYPSLAFLDPHDEKSEDELDEHRRPTSGQEPLPIEALALTSYRPGAVWHPKRLSRGEAIVEVISHAVPAQERPEHTMLTVTRALAHDPLAIASDRDEADSVASLLLAELNHGLPSLRE
jgi:hypothetical protein